MNVKLKKALVPVAWLLTWIGCAVGLLYIGSLPGDLGHKCCGDALCGPWG